MLFLTSSLPYEQFLLTREFAAVVFQLLSHAQLFVTSWTAALQASSLSLTISWSLPKFMPIDSMMPSNHLTLCFFFCLQSFPASGSFPMSQVFTSDDQSIGASVLPKGIHDYRASLDRTITSCRMLLRPQVSAGISSFGKKLFLWEPLLTPGESAALLYHVTAK